MPLLVSAIERREEVLFALGVRYSTKIMHALQLAKDRTILREVKHVCDSS